MVIFYIIYTFWICIQQLLSKHCVYLDPSYSLIMEIVVYLHFSMILQVDIDDSFNLKSIY